MQEAEGNILRTFPIRFPCLTSIRCEEHAPWDKRSQFWRLESELNRLRAALPNGHRLGSRNTAIHIHNGTSRTYVLIHAIFTLCTISLYREYMAFLPWKVEAPQGPLDKPTIKEKEPDADYWIDQARKCFGAAKEFADLLRSCWSHHSHLPHQSQGFLVETPIVGWTTYIVGWCGMYKFSLSSLIANSSSSVLSLFSAHGPGPCFRFGARIQ